MGLVVALVGANLLVTLGGRLRIFGALVGREVLWWALVLVLLLYSRLIERRIVVDRLSEA